MPPKNKIISDEDIKKFEDMKRLVMEEIKVKFRFNLKIFFFQTLLFLAENTRTIPNTSRKSKDPLNRRIRIGIMAIDTNKINVQRLFSFHTKIKKQAIYCLKLIKFKR